LGRTLFESRPVNPLPCRGFSSLLKNFSSFRRLEGYCLILNHFQYIIHPLKYWLCRNMKRDEMKSYVSIFRKVLVLMAVCLNIIVPQNLTYCTWV